MAKVETKKENSRFVGKIKNFTLESGSVVQSITIDNPSENRKDGSPDPYHKGNLLWYDKQTDTLYAVKQMKISTPKNGMPESQSQHGFVANVILELDNQYHAEAKTQG